MVFTTPTGRPLDPSSVTQRFHTLLDHAGLRRTRFHDLRRTCATPLLEQGVELVTIKELLGHAHIAVSAEAYAHVRLRLQHQAIEALNDGDDPGNPDGEEPRTVTTVRGSSVHRVAISSTEDPDGPSAAADVAVKRRS
ncbi:tyrosine-type recombinase/integrase [Streptomyces fuscigenes]|uniref:tyrosine-type recombinase/integrase n=1 Tax=Streptomyces fuscigenes TaxID=1528880 RepID=UPI003557511C